MTDRQNYTRLPTRDRRAVWAMVLMTEGLSWNTYDEAAQWELLAQEARRYREVRGWYVWADSAPATPEREEAELQCSDDLSDQGSNM